MSKEIELWYDTETSGLSPNDGAVVLQFSGQLVDNGKVVKEFNHFINPESYGRDYTISPEALETNGLKEEDFKNYGTLETCMQDIMSTLTVMYPKTKVRLLGYNNSTFDKYFIEDMFTTVDKKFYLYFKWKQIDVFELVKALQFMGLMGKTFNQKLQTIAEYFDIEPEGDWHDAMTDVKATRAVYLKIKEKLT